ncbi:MAG: dipeptidase [Bacteroidota bacterium]
MRPISRSRFLKQSMHAALLSSMAWGARSTPFDKNPNAERRIRAAQNRIREDWEVALQILNPSRRDLEHGMELHKESLVIDTYGFMPRAAPDGERIRESVEANASPLEIQDLREDMSMSRFVDAREEREELARAWEAAGVNVVVQNCGEEGNRIDRLLKRLARFTWTTDRLPEIVSKAVTPDDLERVGEEGGHALYFTGNGVPLPMEWVSPEEELRFIRVFYQLGIRMMHMTYNRRNVIGEGCAEEANGGISDFGRMVVAEMNRVGVIPDVSHSGWQTSLETAKASEKPVVASHSTAGALHPHMRSKPDEVIRAIADTDGYIGICCIPRFLRGSGDIARLLEHIDYVKRTFGPQYVAIGTDVAYTSRHAADQQESIPPLPRSRTRWAALWPEDPFDTTESMRRSLAWTNWPLFTTGLVQMGYTDDEIRMILGGNALRVAHASFV